MSHATRPYDDRPAPRPALRVVAEAGGAYAVALDRLGDAVGEVVAVPTDELDDTQVADGLSAIETQIRRLRTCQTELVGARRDRETRRAREAHGRTGQAAERASRHAERQVEQDLTAELQWRPAASRAAVKTARQLGRLGPGRDALRSGDLPPDHALILTDVLDDLVGEERAHVEARLVEAGRKLDPTSFRRLCDRTRAELDTAAAQQALDRRHARRRAALKQNPDGTHSLFATLSGVDAETVYAGIDAFRTPDAEGEVPRSSGQRTADALVAMARAALDHGTTTRQHGVRPHVMVVVDWTTLTAGSGVAELTWTGPVPVTEIRRLLDDCNVVRIVTGPDGIPVDVGRAARSAPVGTWRAIVARDRHCTWRGCDAPPSMCQTAHLDRRWVDGAGTSHHEMALLCHRHHRHVDRLGLTGRIVDGRVIWDGPRQRSRPGTHGTEPPTETRAEIDEPVTLDTGPPHGRPPQG